MNECDGCQSPPRASRLARLVWLSLGAALLLAALLAAFPVHGLACDLVVRLALLVLACACVAAGLRSVPLERRWFAGLGGPRIARLYAALAFIVYAWISGRANGWSADHALSDYPDPISYFVQARIMASGHLSVPAPQPRDFFNTPYCMQGSRFYGMYPPGWPALLAAGVALRVPWLVNPLLASLGLLALHRLGRVLYGDTLAGIAMVLASLWSSVSWFAASYFSETASFLFATLALIGLVEAERSRPVPSALLCGASLGLLFLIRPWTAVALALPVGLCWLSILWRRRSFALPTCAAVAAFALLAGLHLGYNAVQTGHVHPLPMSLYNPANALGFGFRSTDSGLPLEYFGPIRAGRLLLREMASSNTLMMPLVLPLALAAVWRRRKPGDLLLGVCAASIVAFHVAYFSHGARHWLPLTAAFALLAVRGVMEIARLLPARFPSLRSPELVLSIVAPVALATLVISAQSTASLLHRSATLADPYRRVTGAALTNAIVFLASAPAQYSATGHYVQEAPAFDAPVLFGQDRPGEGNAEVLRRYPGRVPYRYSFRLATGQGTLRRMTETAAARLPGAEKEVN